MYPEHGSLIDEPLLRVEGLLAPGLAEPVSFSVRPGEIFGLTGQLGSGASIVVRSLAGMLPQANRPTIDQWMLRASPCTRLPPVLVAAA